MYGLSSQTDASLFTLLCCFNLAQTSFIRLICFYNIHLRQYLSFNVFKTYLLIRSLYVYILKTDVSACFSWVNVCFFSSDNDFVLDVKGGFACCNVCYVSGYVAKTGYNVQELEVSEDRADVCVSLTYVTVVFLTCLCVLVEHIRWFLDKDVCLSYVYIEIDTHALYYSGSCYFNFAETFFFAMYGLSSQTVASLFTLLCCFNLAQTSFIRLICF